jgi:hypothetical protein
MFAGLTRPSTASGMGPERPTRAGVAPQPGVAPKGRSTLLLDGSAPPVVTGDPGAEGPPIVVPASAAPPPKAVTQAPPWSQGAAHVGIPKGAPPPRAREPSIEEISQSMLLPAEISSEAKAVNVEELSGSVLVEDAPDGKGIVVKTPPPSATPRPASVKPPVPGSVPPAKPASIKPPLPASASTRPAAQAHRTLLGMMPELPKATPAPRLDMLGVPVSRPPAAPVAAPVPAHAPAPAPAPAGVDPFAQPQPVEYPPSVIVAPPTPYPPPTAPMTGDVELTRLPGGRFDPILQKARQLSQRLLALLPENTALRTYARAPWFLPAVAAAGLIVGIGLVGLLVSAFRGGSHADDRETPGPSASARASATLPTSTAAPSSPSPVPPTTPASLPACTLAGTPHVIGPSATVVAGVEVNVAGADLALGFAPTDHDAMAVRVSAATLSASATAKARSRDPIRRVTPILGAKGGLTLAVDTDRKGDKLQGRRTVRSSPPVQIGATADGHLAWAKPGGNAAGQLWALADSGGAVDALRGASDVSGDPTVAIAFRRGGAVYMGTLAGTGGLAPSGDLSKVDGLGTAIGSPAVAISSDVVIVAWADRASSDQPWGLRWTRFTSGAAAGDARAFTPPGGGKGPPIMSPAIAAAPGGRFLLVWTEGPASGHAVRALTLGADGTPLGPPLDLSAEGMNAGQAQVAITPDGAGVVAFLESSGSGFEVAATGITCGKP